MILQVTYPVEIILNNGYGPYIDEYANSVLISDESQEDAK
jgi:hypothetical protein